MASVRALLRTGQMLLRTRHRTQLLARFTFPTLNPAVAVNKIDKYVCTERLGWPMSQWGIRMYRGVWYNNLLCFQGRVESSNLLVVQGSIEWCSNHTECNSERWFVQQVTQWILPGELYTTGLPYSQSNWSWVDPCDLPAENSSLRKIAVWQCLSRLVMLRERENKFTKKFWDQLGFKSKTFWVLVNILLPLSSHHFLVVRAFWCQEFSTGNL